MPSDRGTGQCLTPAKTLNPWGWGREIDMRHSDRWDVTAHSLTPSLPCCPAYLNPSRQHKYVLLFRRGHWKCSRPNIQERGAIAGTVAVATSVLDLLDTILLSEDGGAWEVFWSHEKRKIPEGGSDSPCPPESSRCSQGCRPCCCYLTAISILDQGAEKQYIWKDPEQRL